MPGAHGKNLVPAVFARRQLGVFINDSHISNQLFRQCAIPANILTDDIYIDAQKLAKLAELVWAKLDDESTGYAQSPLRLGFFKMLCNACISCKNLREVVFQSCDFFRIVSDEYHFRLEEKGKTAELILSHHSHNSSDYFMVCLTVVLTRFYARLIGEELKLVNIIFGFKPFCSSKYLTSMFSCDVSFGANETVIRFPAHYLTRVPSLTLAQLDQLVAGAPQTLLFKYRGERNFVELVKKQLLLAENLGCTSQHNIAGALNISTITLSRKLKAYGTTFMTVKDGLRKYESINLMKQHKSILEITELLGFSEPSAFSRAFSNWTGVSPKVYRQSMI